MKRIEVVIKGVTPLLQHKFGEQAEQPGDTRATLVTRGTPREEAAKVAYQDKKTGSFYFPAVAILRSIGQAASNHKLKGSRKSARFVVPAAVFVIGDTISILNGDGKSPAPDFEVDSRPVTIPATKGRIMRHRPRFDCWSARFTLRINEKLLPVDFVQTMLNQAGEAVGIGDYRPEKYGPFGTFNVIEWAAGKE